MVCSCGTCKCFSGHSASEDRRYCIASEFERPRFFFKQESIVFFRNCYILVIASPTVLQHQSTTLFNETCWKMDPWRRVLCEKMIAQMVNKFSNFCGRLKTFPSSLYSTFGPSVESYKTFAKLYIFYLTLILLTWKIWWAPNNARIWQMGFNWAFKGLN
jgi:hypothetical protein